MARKLVVVVLVLISVISCISCQNSKYGIDVFKEEKIKKLAKAVDKQDVDAIEKIIKEDDSKLDYLDPTTNLSLLHWSIGNEKYKSAQKLLELGANPNTRAFDTGEPPIFTACTYSWLRDGDYLDIKYAKLLLEYGADPNLTYEGIKSTEYQGVIPNGSTALSQVVGVDLEKTKLLVEHGADINLRDSRDNNPVYYSIILTDNPEYAYYLIIENHAKVNIEIEGMVGDNKIDLVQFLRIWVFDLDSKEYKMKLDIIKEFENQGADYDSTFIPRDVLEKIKKRYPDTWEEYIKVY